MAVEDAWRDVWALVAEEPRTSTDSPHTLGLPRLCRAAARALPALGVGVSLMSEAGDPTPVAASGPAAARIEELQFTVGEGPCLDAYASRGPVLVPDLAGAATFRWPGYARAAHEHGVRAVFAFPLQMGAARLGALDVYCDQPGHLPEPSLVRALTFADVAMTALLDASDPDGGDESGGAFDDGEDGMRVLRIDDALGARFELYQAQGMVMVQLGMPADQAMARLRAYAYANERQLSAVADDVVSGRLNLARDGA